MSDCTIEPGTRLFSCAAAANQYIAEDSSFAPYPSVRRLAQDAPALPLRCRDSGEACYAQELPGGTPAVPRGRLNGIQAGMENAVFGFPGVCGIGWPVDVITDEDGLRLFMVFHYAEDAMRRMFPGGAFAPLAEQLPLCAAPPPERAPQWCAALRALCGQVKAAGFSLGGFSADQVWVEPEGARLFLQADTGVCANRLLRCGVRRAADLCRPAAPERPQAEPAAGALDDFSLAALCFWMEIGCHPFACRSVQRWSMPDARAQQYQYTPYFVFDDRYPQERIGVFANEEDAEARWRALAPEAQKNYLEIFRLSSAQSDHTE